MRVLKQAMMVAVLAAAFSLVSRCGPAKGNSISARTVASPMSGYSCFAIVQDDRAVGGNCVKD